MENKRNKKNITIHYSETNDSYPNTETDNAITILSNLENQYMDQENKNNVFLETSEPDVSNIYTPKYQSKNSDITINTTHTTETKDKVTVNRFDYATCNINFKSYEKVSDAFFAFFESEIISYSLKLINKKVAKSKKNNTEMANSYVLEDEFTVFIGVLIYFSINKPKSIKRIWSRDSLLYNPFIVSIISRKRFMFIYSKFTFFSKKDKSNGYIVKKPKIFKKLVSLFQDSLEPGENLSLDETISDFKGRVLNKTFNPLKPKKYGVKFYTLTDSRTSFLLDIQVVGEPEKLQNMILNITRPYQYKDRIVHMDNYYNSVETSLLLLEAGTHSNGTVKKRRGVPDNVMMNIPKKYDYNMLIIKDKVFYYNYNDNKNVTFISTVWQNDFIYKEAKQWNRDKKTGRKVSVKVMKKIPKAIDEYNKNMNGCDKLNQSLHYLGLKRKSKKWDRKISLFTLELMIHNSYILWSPVCAKNKKKAVFIEELSKNLMKYVIPTEYSHFCDTGKKRGRCVECYKENIRRETNHFCVACVKYLCSGKCYANYHDGILTSENERSHDNKGTTKENDL